MICQFADLKHEILNDLSLDRKLNFILNKTLGLNKHANVMATAELEFCVRTTFILHCFSTQ